MAIKIIENENGTFTEKTSRQVTRERSESSKCNGNDGGYACCFFSVRFCRKH